MATRRLQVDIVGDSRDLNRALRSSGAQIGMLERRFGTTGRVASTAFSRIGSAARAATPYVAGGLALGLAKAVAEAREAEKAGAQTRAVIKSMGNSANVSAGQVESLAEAISLKSGIDDEAIQSGQNLLLTFANIRNEAGKGNQIFNRTTQIATDMSVALGQDMKASAIQLGKALNDPTVGLTSLRRVGVSFNEQQSEQIKTMFESGKQMKAQKTILAELEKEFGGSAAAQADALDRIKVAGNNFAEQIGLKVLPEIERLSDGITNIISDKKLTGEEKFSKIADLLTDEVIKGIDKLADASPKIAAAGGRVGLKLAGAVAEGFLKADLLGKLFIGGALIRVLGGPGAFGAIGTFIGRKIGARMAQTTVAQTASSGILSKLFGGAGGGGAAPVGGKWGKAFGIAAVAAASVYVATHWEEVGNAIDPKDGFTPLSGSNREEFADELNANFGGNAQFIGPGNKVKVATEVGDLIFNAETKRVIAAKGKQLKGLVGKTFGGGLLSDVDSIKLGPKIGQGLDDLARLAKSKFGKLAGIAESDMAKVGKSLTKHPEKARATMASTYDRIIAKIRKAMASGAIATSQGMAKIESLTAAKLRLFGVGSIAQAVSGAGGQTTTPGKGAGNGGGGGGGGGWADQRGALHKVPGTGTGDKFPVRALLEPGELFGVVNRKAAAQIEAANAAWPRFAKGTVEGRESVGKGQRGAGSDNFRLPRWGYNYAVGAPPAAGLNMTAAIAEKLVKESGGGAFGTIGNLVALGRALQRQGYQVGEHPAFGGGHMTGHSATGYHPQGRAIDVNFDGQGQAAENAALDRIHGPLSRNPNVVELIWRAPDHYDHLHVAMRGGGVIPRQPAHGQRWIKGGRPGTYSPSEAATLAWQAGASPAEAKLLSTKIIGESGGRTGAVGNDPGGTTGLGLWQITTSFNNDLISKYGGREAMKQPIPNALAAIDILRRQGIGAWYAGSNAPGRLLRNRILDPNVILASKSGQFKSVGDAAGYLKKFGIGDAKGKARKFFNKNPGKLKGAAGKGGGSGGGSAPITVSPGTSSTGSGGASSGGSGSTGGSGSSTGASTVSSLPPVGTGLNILSGAGLGYQSQMELLDAHAAIAEGTEGTADDDAVRGRKVALMTGRNKKVLGSIGRLTKRIKSTKVTKKNKAKIKAAKEKRGALISEHAGLVADIAAAQAEAAQAAADAQQEAADAAKEAAEAQAQATVDLAEEMRLLRLEITKQNQIAEHELAIGLAEARRAFADVLSGELGGRVAARGHTAGAGSVTRS